MTAVIGRHSAPARRRFPLPAWITSFLRLLRPAEGGRAAPYPPRGAAPLQPERPGLRVCCFTATGEPHSGLCAADTVRARPDGVITVEGDGRVTVRKVNGRNLGTRPRWYLDVSTLPRRKPMVNRQPWQTMGQPALPEPEPAGPLRAWDQGDGLRPQSPIVRRYLDERPGGTK
jgi:hypothetical protein